MLFVPMGWGHATANDQVSIGVSVEFEFADEAPKAKGKRPTQSANMRKYGEVLKSKTAVPSRSRGILAVSRRPGWVVGVRCAAADVRVSLHTHS